MCLNQRKAACYSSFSPGDEKRATQQRVVDRRLQLAPPRIRRGKTRTLGVMAQYRTSKLRQVLREAVEGKLEDAWVYLKDEAELSPESECLVLGDVEESLEYATALGFPLEGLDTPSIEDCVAWALTQQSDPSDELLLYSFRYYRFDAFPAHAWAPDPPPAEEVRRSLALDFYRSLGPERSDVRCRREGCANGAIRQSVLCRVHHYEMIRNEPCPFHGDA